MEQMERQSLEGEQERIEPSCEVTLLRGRKPTNPFEDVDFKGYDGAKVVYHAPKTAVLARKR